MPRLEDWGWDDRWAAEFVATSGKSLTAARVMSEHRGSYNVISADGERKASLPGAMRHKSEERASLPAVGDWLAVEVIAGERGAMVRHLLDRRTKLSRKASGETQEEQVIAANLDTVFVTTALNQDFNMRRLERFLTVSQESGAEPVLLLNKLDACPDPESYLSQAREIAGRTPIVCMSAKVGTHIEELDAWIKPGRTVGFIGSSGVGKSTIINRLLGTEKIKTNATRQRDERGRHTTTRRELFLLTRGGVLLDTPGMREMQFWDAEQGLAQTFEEIDALSSQCRFKDCAHQAEPGCAVKAGVESGAVAPARLESWRKLKSETDARKTAQARKNWNNPPKG